MEPLIKTQSKNDITLANYLVTVSHYLSYSKPLSNLLLSIADYTKSILMLAEKRTLASALS